MPTTRVTSSCGALTVDHTGSEQQADLSMDVDPTNRCGATSQPNLPDRCALVPEGGIFFSYTS